MLAHSFSFYSGLCDKLEKSLEFSHIIILLPVIALFINICKFLPGRNTLILESVTEVKFQAILL